MSAAYDEDLAYIHDAGFGGFARASAPGVLHMLRSCGVDAGLVVDLGCGSGIWARELVDSGYEVIGVDISPAFVKMAKARVPEGSFRVGSWLQSEIPGCRAVTALGEVLNYRFDMRNRLPALKQLFRRVHHALEPGGVFVFDIAEPTRDQSRGRAWWEGDDWANLVEFAHNANKKQLTRRIVTFRKAGDHYRRREETHELQLYDGAKVADTLRSVGFRVRRVRSYGEYSLPKSLLGFVARKS